MKSKVALEAVKRIQGYPCGMNVFCKLSPSQLSFRVPKEEVEFQGRRKGQFWGLEYLGGRGCADEGCGRKDPEDPVSGGSRAYDGHGVWGGTVRPCQLQVGAVWDQDLVGEISRAKGGRWAAV